MHPFTTGPLRARLGPFLLLTLFSLLFLAGCGKKPRGKGKGQPNPSDESGYVVSSDDDDFGNLEAVNDESIAGWAWDEEHPNEPVKVDIYDGEKLLGTATADVFREDLKQAGKGNGKHGFEFPTPEGLNGAKADNIRVILSGTKRRLKDIRNAD